VWSLVTGHFELSWLLCVLPCWRMLGSKMWERWGPPLWDGQCRIQAGGTQAVSRAPPPWDGGVAEWLTSQKHAHPNMGYHPKFHADVEKSGCLAFRLLRTLNVLRNWRWSIGNYDFLLVTNNFHGLSRIVSEIQGDFSWKSQIVLPSVGLLPARWGVTLVIFNGSKKLLAPCKQHPEIASANEMTKATIAREEDGRTTCDLLITSAAP